MKRRVPLGEIYRREADRLRSMADAFFYYEARDEFLAVARRFEELALREAQPAAAQEHPIAAAASS